jgi:hypothetical protein
MDSPGRFLLRGSLGEGRRGGWWTRARIQTTAAGPTATSKYQAGIPTLDPNVRRCEFLPGVVTAGGRRFVFMPSRLAYAYEVDRDLHILHEPQRITALEPVYSIGGFRNGQ